MAKTRKATEDDIIVGRKIYSTRVKAGLSQSALAERVGVTFQQVQKYEKGNNRVAVSTLMRLAVALDVKPESLLPIPDPEGEAVEVEQAPVLGSMVEYAATQRIAKRIGEIRNPKLRNKVLQIIDLLITEEETDAE